MTDPDPTAEFEVVDTDPTGEWDPQTTTWWQREFTDGVDPEYVEQIIPIVREQLSGAGRILDVGAGEGQVSRALAADGAQVTALEPNWHHYRSPGEAIAAVRGAADGLPFADGSFDAVVVCLVFEHVDEVDRAIAEIGRVLRPGGTFLFLLNHPLLQTPGSGWIDDQMIEPPEQYWRIGPYLVEDATVEEVQKGVFIRFVHRPLSRYVNTLAANGLVLTEMLEPAPPPGFLAKAAAFRDAATVPRLLVMRTEKLPMGPPSAPNP